MDAAGVVKAGFTYTGANSNAVADNLLNNAGNAGLRSNGESFANSVIINTAALPGAACPTNDAMVWGAGSTSRVLLKCVANVWTATGTIIGAVGGACIQNGQLGETTTQASIICVGNVWQTTTSRMGSWAVMSTAFVVNGSVVGKPVCGSGGLPRLIDVPKGIDASGLYANFDIQDNGPNWTILLNDGAGIGNASTAIAQVGCWYN